MDKTLIGGSAMAERVQKETTKSPRSNEQEIAEAVGNTATNSTTDGEKLKAELDDLLDEIDGVLETNAEDFVKSYVQKGGQ